MMHFFHSACKNCRASGGACPPPEASAGEGMVLPIAAFLWGLRRQQASKAPRLLLLDALMLARLQGRRGRPAS